MAGVNAPCAGAIGFVPGSCWGMTDSFTAACELGGAWGVSLDLSLN